MTISRREFRRLLPAAVGGAVAEAEDAYGGHDGALAWRIQLTDLPPLRLGPCPLERLRVELVFEDATEAQELAFMSRFLRHFQRGGG